MCVCVRGREAGRPAEGGGCVSVQARFNTLHQVQVKSRFMISVLHKVNAEHSVFKVLKKTFFKRVLMCRQTKGRSVSHFTETAEV